jgi:hypothetical protein
MLGIREFKNFYKNVKIGDSFYLNAIGANKKVIDYVRMLIQTKEIAPKKEEIEKVIKKESINKFLTGEAIAPQMTYIKIN